MVLRQVVAASWIGILASVVYGVIHDQITVRIFAPYLTVWHPKIVETDNPTLVALAWGFAATWWMGAILGALVGLACYAGPRVPRTRKTVGRAIGLVMVLSGLGAALAGILASTTGFVAPDYLMGRQIVAMGPESQHKFSVVWAIHNASYSVAFWSALIASLVIYLKRPKVQQNGPDSQAVGAE